MATDTTPRLLIDAGNSAVKCLRACGRELLIDGLHSFAHDDPALSEYLQQQWHDPSVRPAEVLLASVAGIDWEQRFRALDTEHSAETPIPIRQLRSAGEHPLLRNGYRNPQQLGVDRWLAMLGARISSSGPLCVVDLGTATTLDAIEATGQHLGGWILPGLATSQRALHRSGHLLAQAADSLAEAAPATGFANHTAAAIYQGCLQAQVASIEAFLQRLSAHCQPPTAAPDSADQHFRSPGPRLFLTGGWAQVVLGLLSYEAIYDPYLIFRGMLAQRSVEITNAAAGSSTLRSN